MTITDGITALAVMTACIGAVVDHRTGHIPNKLTLGVLVVAPILWLGAGVATAGVSAGLAAAGTSLAGALACGIGPAFIFWRGGIGGGDVKLLAALGALLGPRIGTDAEFAAFVVASAFIPGRLAWDGKLFRVLGGGIASLFTRNPAPAELRARHRLGPFILAGTLLALLFAHQGTS